jgi:hypothetical protein
MQEGVDVVMPMRTVILGGRLGIPDGLGMDYLEGEGAIQREEDEAEVVMLIGGSIRREQELWKQWILTF